MRVVWEAIGGAVLPVLREADQVTGREICEAYMRLIGVPEERVEEAALAFWNRSPTGELSHVFAAAEELRAAGITDD